MKTSDKYYIENYIRTFYLNNSERIYGSVKKAELREWAILTIDNTMMRHLEFSSIESFKKKILNSLPKGVYYSASYYKNPSEEMDLKGRISTDLIFDLDADHMNKIRLKFVFLCKNPECRYLGSSQRCEKCGSETKAIPIIDDETISDVIRQLKTLLERLDKYLGIKKEMLKIYFSGLRGFHIHIEEEPFITLDDLDRIALKDFIVLDGIDITDVRDSNSYLISLLKENFDELLSECDDEDVKRVLTKSKEYFDQHQKLLSFLKQLKEVPELKRKVNNCMKINLGIGVDAAVLTDLSRLIRAPYSLHGKSGLYKVDIELDDLDDATKIIEKAMPSKLNSKVFVYYLPNIFWAGVEYGPFYNDYTILPEPLSIYLINSGIAEDVSIP